MVVVDHQQIVTHEDLAQAFDDIIEVHQVGDWFSLRRAWERYGRGRSKADPRLVLLTSDVSITRPEDLPFDIEQATVMRRVRVPGDPVTQSAILDLDDELGDLAVERIQVHGLSSTEAVLATAVGLPPIAIATSPGEQLRLALRLVTRALPISVVTLARTILTDGLALSVLEDPAWSTALEQAWASWVGHPTDPHLAMRFEACRSEMVELFFGGALTPVRGDAQDLPSWASIGVRGASPSERVDVLMAERIPDAHTFSDWVRTAQWWGEVRSNLAQVNPPIKELSARAWAVWAQLDERFQVWLRSQYGPQLSRSWTNGPVSLDKVQPFLRTRLSTTTDRILLIVLDGLGFAQWSLIRDRCRLRVLRAGGTLAMVPTLTEVSRQAISAGAPPLSFAASLRTTSRESQHWSYAWGEVEPDAVWRRIDGAHLEELDFIPLETARVIGVVLSITDELMHSAEQMGDRGLHAGLSSWIQSGVLDTLVGRGSALGFEVWITADHGNLECVPAKEPREGAFVERAGTRVRRYASKVLRDQAAADGARWDAIPGLPVNESEQLLFASGRTGWGSSRVSHGGLSLDEVLVPFVQVTLP